LLIVCTIRARFLVRNWLQILPPCYNLQVSVQRIFIVTGTKEVNGVRKQSLPLRLIFTPLLLALFESKQCSFTPSQQSRDTGKTSVLRVGTKLRAETSGLGSFVMMVFFLRIYKTNK
jgi:hypothetical protein